MPRWRVPCSVVFMLLILPFFNANPIMASSENSDSIQYLDVVIEDNITHNISSWTQGLLIHEGYIYESTGKKGFSTLQRINMSTGIVEEIYNHNDSIFAEGLTIHDGKLIQLTYVSNIAFVFDLDSFDLVETYNYSGEGWGLCAMSEFFVMSNGSSQLSLRDLETFELINVINVTKNGAPLIYLNELECVGNLIYSNVWLTNEIVVIDLDSGNVTSSINASGLLTFSEEENADVLNGIAFDGNSSEFWITGKYWPYIFQVTFEEKHDLVNETDNGENLSSFENEEIIDENIVESDTFVNSLIILLIVCLIIWVFDLKLRGNSEKTQVQEHSGE
tara:strand:+ start:189 stop:1187 length:999 start_codon:yes stop_codon:yes gene_type:complete